MLTARLSGSQIGNQAKVDDSQGGKRKWQQELERVNADYSEINEKFRRPLSSIGRLPACRRKRKSRAGAHGRQLTEETSTETDLAVANAINLAQIDIRIAEADQLAAAFIWRWQKSTRTTLVKVQTCSHSLNWTRSVKRMQAATIYAKSASQVRRTQSISRPATSIAGKASGEAIVRS